MKHARFMRDGRVRSAILMDGVLLDDAGNEVPACDVDTWLPPFVPGKMIGIALNYADHAAELKLETPREPVLFIKPNNTLIGHKAPVVYPDGVKHMHYEAELAVVIGRAGRSIHAKHALDYVKGYTIANDVTVRDFVGNMYRPPIRAKGQDTFGPLGPYLVDKEDVENPGNLAVRTYVNGELKQSGNTSDLIFPVEELIAFISSFMTLEPGDVIWTGTPKGISPVLPGDVMRVEVESVGALENAVVAPGKTAVSPQDRKKEVNS